MASIWDKRISISIFGEPDAPAMGVTIGNLPVGEYINAEELANYMARRVPNLGDAAEADIVPSPRIMSGISNERTTGAPLCAFIQNVRRSPNRRAITLAGFHVPEMPITREQSVTGVSVTLRAEAIFPCALQLRFALQERYVRRYSNAAEFTRGRT